MQQRHTSFVKQAAFNYPFNTILTIIVNFNEKLVCTPAGYHTIRATDKQEFGHVAPRHIAGAIAVGFTLS